MGEGQFDQVLEPGRNGRGGKAGGVERGLSERGEGGLREGLRVAPGKHGAG